MNKFDISEEAYKRGYEEGKLAAEKTHGVVIEKMRSLLQTILEELD